MQRDQFIIINYIIKFLSLYYIWLLTFLFNILIYIRPLDLGSSIFDLRVRTCNLTMSREHLYGGEKKKGFSTENCCHYHKVLYMLNQKIPNLSSIRFCLAASKWYKCFQNQVWQIRLCLHHVIQCQCQKLVNINPTYLCIVPNDSSLTQLVYKCVMLGVDLCMFWSSSCHDSFFFFTLFIYTTNKLNYFKLF